MFKRDDASETETGLVAEILLRGVVCLVRTVCGCAAGHCDDSAGLFGHAKRGVEVFHNRVFAGAVQSVDE